MVIGPGARRLGFALCETEDSERFTRKDVRMGSARYGHVAHRNPQVVAPGLELVDAGIEAVEVDGEVVIGVRGEEGPG
jgi:hypothetical protein